MDYLALYAVCAVTHSDAPLACLVTQQLLLVAAYACCAAGTAALIWLDRAPPAPAPAQPSSA